jgi:hypothetical protein
MKRPLLAAAVLAALVASIPGPATAGPRAAVTPGRIAARVAPERRGGLPGDSNYLYAVDGPSASELWAVGGTCSTNCAAPHAINHTLTLHWNGNAWSKLPSPSPTSNSDLEAVSEVSASDVWAAGTQVAQDGSRTPLIEHWNGAKWSVSPSPEFPFSFLNGISALPNEAWAVGERVTNGGGDVTLIEHWNGSTWKSVPSPSPAPENTLLSVDALSSTNVWAVGYTNPSQGKERTLVEHWNGHTWARVVSPNQSATYNSLHGVSGTSANDVWAVGQYTTAADLHHTYVLHWNGSKWRHVSAPDPGTSNDDLLGVDASGSADAWAGGEGPKGPLLLHWNGSKWKNVDPPSGVSPTGNSYGVADIGPHHAFSAGGAYQGPGMFTAVLLRWNGTNWVLQ